jgi:hypothetical protein
MRTRELGLFLSLTAAILASLPYWSVSRILSIGIAVTAIGIGLRRSPGASVFFSTVAYTVPFALLLSSMLLTVSPATHSFIASVFSSSYFSSPLYALAVLGTAILGGLAESATRLGEEGWRVIAHSLPYVIVGIALSSVMIIVSQGISLRTSPLVVPLIILAIPTLLIPLTSESGEEYVVVVKAEKGPIRILNGEDLELYPSPLARLDDGRIRVEVTLKERPREVYAGGRRLKKVVEGKRGDRVFILYA